MEKKRKKCETDIMKMKVEEENGRTLVRIEDECALFYRMGDERDYRTILNVDGKEYFFTALKTDCPFASVSLKLYENTNKRTRFALIITFDRVVSIT